MLNSIEIPNSNEWFLILWLLHGSCLLILTGLIWTIQRVHYPLFAHVGSADFIAFQRNHVKRITPVVAPLMLVELASGILLFFTEISLSYMIPNFVGILIIWCSTLLIQIPIHQKLSLNYDLKLIGQLVNTNWLRTISWSLRAILFITYLYAFLKGVD